MTRQLGQRILCTADFVDGHQGDFRSHGMRALRGIAQTVELFAPEGPTAAEAERSVAR